MRGMSPKQCWLRCMKGGTASMTKASIQRTATRCLPRLPAWACKNPKRACGKTMSAAPVPRHLPQGWNERSTSLIGATPKSDREGVLQDVHWSLGMFGYFPTYTLGSVYAAQLAEAYAYEHPLDDEIRRGE